MTEQEWLECNYPQHMLGNLCQRVGERQLSKRKLRLFSSACRRRLWYLLIDERSQRAIETAERHADNLASDKELVAAYCEAKSAADSVQVPAGASEAAFAVSCKLDAPAFDAADGAAHNAANAKANADSSGLRSWFDAHTDESKMQSRLLRDIFGNPFRPITIDPRWLTSTVVDLARAIYDERAFDRMPILADALMDAGCDSEEIISHCRQSGEHVRGCWVVDLLTGRK